MEGQRQHTLYMPLMAGRNGEDSTISFAHAPAPPAFFLLRDYFSRRATLSVDLDHSKLDGPVTILGPDDERKPRSLSRVAAQTCWPGHEWRTKTAMGMQRVTGRSGAFVGLIQLSANQSVVVDQARPVILFLNGFG